MAERRIMRRNQGMYKPVHDTSIILEEDEDAEEKIKLNKAIISKSKDATVEVTVKVKKRRDKSGESGKRSVPIRDKEFRKGSWGDLLSNSRTSLVCKDIKTESKGKPGSSPTNPKGSVGEDAGDGKYDKKKDNEGHSPLCQKIPLTDDLYLETHTHIRKSQSADNELKSRDVGKSKMSAATLRQRSLVRENDDLRDQVERLLREIEVTRTRPRSTRSRSDSRTYDIPDQPEKDNSKKFKALTQSTQTSTTCLLSPKKIIPPPDSVDSRSPGKKSSATATTSTSSTTAPPISTESPAAVAMAQIENLRLEKENEALRDEAAKLVEDMHRARLEYLECCNTMKELHNIAEVLKRDNFDLAQKHKHQQTLEGKLIQAMAENREMKEILESIVDKQKSSHGLQDEQLSQIRNVIRDVKRTIAQEMQGLTVKPNSSFCVEKDDAGSVVGMRIGESFLNDTNASEIQRILGEPPEVRRGNSQEDRSSSTQYLTLGGLSVFDSHYLPSPVAVSKYSPRVSTPNSSNISQSLSEAEGGGFIPVQPIAMNSARFRESEDNGWRALQEQVARSFIPVENGLSDGSTSSYSSTSSSPNPE